MQGRIIEITEGMYGDILILESTDGLLFESRGFINGRNKVLAEGDIVNFTIKVNSINKAMYAKIEE